ncbi:pre-rRNA-processing protein TSR1 homolog isoform X2 [Cylas formicarius]|uniref:pre-rRNA-processing protein TSR1 homolog isoform X2 n=1 Tax=Cylas formicarius TaxID=197179 RepID=UPI002958B71E|nr:pre-rRNA-processing protein TSR1 homolog isoform X2 [Cylas formicarius]
MAMEKVQTHRPGIFKQTNKEHKHGRHRSKGSISIANKGKTSVKIISKRNKSTLNREQRRNQALQIRQKKRDEVLLKRRSLGEIDSAPFFVCIIPLNKDFDTETAVSILTKCDEEASVKKSSTGVIHVSIPRFKKKVSFVVPQKDNYFSILDCLKVADTVLFLVSAVFQGDDNLIVDDWRDSILTACFAQGLPTPIFALTDLESIAPKKRHDCKQTVQKFIDKLLPHEKLMTLDKNVDGINILRRICNQKKRTLHFRDNRPHLYAEEVEYIPDQQGALGKLKVTGYLRGKNLSVNQLVHIPLLGDFQMSQIDAANGPNKIDKNRDSKITDSASTMIKVLEKSDIAKQESLDSENIPDPMDAEQTWPTKDDFDMAEKEQKFRKVKKAPEGWSDYQASWIPDDDAEFQLDEGSEEEEGSHEDYMDARSEEASEKSDDNEEKALDTVTESDIVISDEKYDKEMDFYAEREDLEKLKAAQSDLMFPDEVDTPQNQLARVRFQKYRGLESFRTSPWDIKQNLPSDYARIFKFENFDRTRKRMLKKQREDGGVLPGWYVTVHISNVSQLMWSSFERTRSPLILIGLFPHEHKMSVLNVVLKRTHDYPFAIKSKERLVFQCGFRRFAVNPIFSQHTNGGKHKFERFFQPESVTVATFYAPIMFPPAPILCFKEVSGKLVTVATGSLLSCNPDRLIIKRLVLSGHPLKIYKRSAVIRFMFFNREDILYFKPCKLRTKMGRTGHIKEPLGTHGHMKCVFDGQLKSQDTVLLNLYKRVFPKWTYEELLVNCTNSDSMDT